MVFDGAELPSKKGTEVNRKTSREEFKAKGLQALRLCPSTSERQRQGKRLKGSEKGMDE